MATLTDSVAAKGLVAVLQQDDTVAALMRSNWYEISLDSSFQFSLANITPEAPGLPVAAADIAAEGTVA